MIILLQLLEYYEHLNTIKLILKKLDNYVKTILDMKLVLSTKYWNTCLLTNINILVSQSRQAKKNYSKYLTKQQANKIAEVTDSYQIDISYPNKPRDKSNPQSSYLGDTDKNQTNATMFHPVRFLFY